MICVACRARGLIELNRSSAMLQATYVMLHSSRRIGTRGSSAACMKFE